MTQFKALASAVRAQFAEMSREALFVVDSDRDAIWEAYLGAFPPGTDPLYRKRTEHDCACCRAFIRAVGPVVAIQNGAVTSIWDLNGLPEPYQTVANAMADHVKALRIRDVYLTRDAKQGASVSHAHIDNRVVTFDHFSAEVPTRFVTRDGDAKRGEMRTTHAVLMRGLTELIPEAVETVADLITDKALYRGEEHARAVTEFQTLQRRFLAADARGREVLAWTLVSSPVARFRNTVIGTLVQDLSEGVDLEKAVKAFETKVAPQNYKRPTALITKAMVEQAMATIRDLGLEPALERRHARLSDVSVNSVLFVDNAVRGQMKGGLEGLLMQEVKPPKPDLKRAEEIGVADFMATVLPKTTGLEVFLDNSLLGNFVSLTAPVHDDVPPLFKWRNNFAWSYDGNVTDSIKDKVKRAGGQVEDVALRVSLAWSNFDDLDLHVHTPDKDHIFYAAKQGKLGRGGYLDVDMNAGGPRSREPVENVRWVNPPKDGVYAIAINQFNRRESIDIGFTVEVESARGLDTLRFEKPLQQGQTQTACWIEVKGGQVQSIKPREGMIMGSVAHEKWGLKTLDLVRVNSVVLSPNHWDDNASGNKHWFFILEGCKNPLPTRGIYNEFLAAGLEKHRKVFEVLGEKTKCPPVDAQLSGIGVSSTRKDKVTVVATGPKLNKTYTVVF